jgi:hypothetical protein
MNQWGFMNSSGRIRATTEVNFKSSMRALVFGEDERVINPGDLLIEMSSTEPGDRLGKNIRKFEIYIQGNQMGGLLDQVTRAADLFEVNEQWLRSPASKPATPLTAEVLIAQDANRLAIHLKHLKGYVPSLALLPASIPIAENAVNLINAVG